MSRMIVKQNMKLNHNLWNVFPQLNDHYSETKIVSENVL